MSTFNLQLMDYSTWNFNNEWKLSDRKGLTSIKYSTPILFTGITFLKTCANHKTAMCQGEDGKEQTGLGKPQTYWTW